MAKVVAKARPAATPPAPAATHAAPPAPAAGPLSATFREGMRQVAASLVERDEEVRLMFTAVVAREHVLLVGPPGTAKSLLCGLLSSFLSGARLWQRQFTKFTEPGEVLGPVDIQALKAGRQTRLYAGMLPSAEIAFLDEVFKANSAILNSLLLILNERQCDIGAGERIDCPLMFCMGASNEWPEEAKELGALFDRFIFRKSVRPIRTAAGLKRLVNDPSIGAAPSVSVTAADVDEAHAEAMALPYSPAAEEAFFRIVAALRKKGICPGDRRVKKAWAAGKASAWLAGASAVEPAHLACLSHVLWEEPGEQPAKAFDVVCGLADPVAADVAAALREASEAIDAMERGDDSSMRACSAKLVSIGQAKLAGRAGEQAEQARAWLKAEIMAIRAAVVESTGGVF